MSDEIQKQREKPKPFVVVQWWDACSHLGVLKDEVLKKPTSDFIFKKAVTPGYILKEDEHGIVIVNHDAGEECDIVAIPKIWKLNIKRARMVSRRHGKKTKTKKTRTK